MSYSRHSSEVDRALDGLGFSYLDGVPFQIDPRIQAVANYDYSRVNDLLGRPLPASGLSEMCTDLLGKMGALEKQVIDQLETLEAEKIARQERERQEDEELERMNAKEKEENENAAAEEANSKEENSDEEVQEEEVVENGDADTSLADTETEPSTASISDVLPREFTDCNCICSHKSIFSITDQNQAKEPTPPVAAPVANTTAVESTATAAATKAPININFSEFEAESDPFERAELQTLNDMQELAAVLQTTSTNPTLTSSPSVMSNPQASSMGTGNMMSSMRYPFYPNHPQVPTSNHQNPYYFHQQHRPPHPNYFPYPSSGLAQQNLQQPQQPHSSAQEMKSSKSVGDIMVEIKKEAEALEKMKIRGHQRKNSQTPPPTPRASNSQANAALEDWIPWPDIGQKSTEARNRQILSDLVPSSQRICKELSEMGFSLERVVNGCKSLGDDKQKLINFCLLVDKILSGGEKFKAADVEYVVPIHNLDEETSKKHLRAFHKLEELGFDRYAIHNALIDTKLDHDKALEKLLK